MKKLNSFLKNATDATKQVRQTSCSRNRVVQNICLQQPQARKASTKKKKKSLAGASYQKNMCQPMLFHTITEVPEGRPRRTALLGMF